MQVNSIEYAHVAMFIIIESEHDDTSSNPKQGCLNFTYLSKRYESNPALNKL